MERVATEEEVFKVDRIVGMRWSKGSRQYHVLWEGYEESQSTWEPMENLVGCAAQIREYETFQEAEDKKAKEDILKKRSDKKAKAAADAAALKAAAAATLAEGDLSGPEGDEGADAVADAAAS